MSTLSTQAKVYTIDLTSDQVDFMLYAFGYLLSTSDRMNDSHKFWIREHHDAVMPKLIGAKRQQWEEPD